MMTRMTTKAAKDRAWVDLNCDMGESFGIYRIGMDEEVMPLITSANVACGFHGGDPDVIARTVELAKKHGVGVGAHVSFPDRLGFGRWEMDIPRDTLVNLIVYQIGALQAFCVRAGVPLQHVKPHGSLNNMADRDREVAKAIVQACLAVVPEAPLFVKPGSALHEEAVAAGVPVIMEVYADRQYHRDGTLVSRRKPNALIEDPKAAAERMVKLVTTGSLATVEGETISLPAQSICVHGDTPQAPSMIRLLREALLEAGIQIAPVSLWA